MNSTQIVDQPTIDRLLEDVDKAARYTGGEVNSVVKEEGVDCRIALAFPDVYEIAESHLGYKILYDVVNSRPSYAAERVYAMWPDLEAKAREEGVPLWSLETHRPLAMFDLVGFSLQYELAYPTLVAMLEHGGLQVWAEQRGDSDPFVIGGGAGAFNPEPIAPFFDAFLLGDGEEAILEIMEVVSESRRQGRSRQATLIELAGVPGVYVPSHFKTTYDGVSVQAIEALEGTPGEATRSRHGTPRINRRTLLDLDNAPYPTKPIIPNVRPVHDRVAVEVQRGCSQGCRFCQAGMITRPTRQRSPETVLRLADEAIQNTGSNAVGLMSLSIGDYEPVNHVLSEFFNKYEDQGLSVGLPSMRTETMNPELAAQVARVRKSGFTFAPEAASERMRRVINKTNTEEDLLNAVRSTVQAGWTHLKFYFMIGLPTETLADVEAIVVLADRARKEGRRINPRVNVTVSVSTFVPKPHTSYQWERQIDVVETKRKQEYLRAELKARRIAFRYHSAEQSFLEGVLSRGDRRLAPAILRAAEAGCRLDAWSEHHDHALWMNVLDESLALYGVKPIDYLGERDEEVLLPWDHLDAGILKKFLRRDRKASYKESTIEDCALKEHCYACGGCDLGDPYLARDPETRERLVSLRPIVHSGKGLGVTPPPEQSAPGPLALTSTPGERTRVRYQFAKMGRGSHISHLDMIEHLERAVRMGGMPVLQSNGPRPRMKLAFGPACPTGIESESEFFDVFCEGDVDPKLYAESVQRWLPQGMAIVNFDTAPWKAPPLNGGILTSTYGVRFDCFFDRELRDLVEEFVMSDRVLVEVERKKKRRILDARAHILDAAVIGSTLQVTLGFFPGGSLKIREAIACIVGVEAMWESRIRKISVELGDSVNANTVDPVNLDGAVSVRDLRMASARRELKVVGQAPSRRESRVVPYAE